MRDYKMINNPERSKWLENLQQTVGLRSNDIAAAVAYTISTPETVTVSEILIHPTKQKD
ncbi:hypothetical protein [Niallia circulans]|uniref:Oxidoreductase n=1 Tax=Niallia circulans TaxID=1397 RepID=A0A941GG96_NIACI|nr:hypothetical protein [Niallia circulans]MCB5239709.1 hypothetical protein [Niallia circulans]